MRVAVIALGAFLGACASHPAAPPEYVGSWQLVSIGDRPASSERTPSLTLDAQGHVNGNGGCNGFGGRYTHSGNVLSFSHMISTMMACAGPNGDDINTQEQAFLSILSGDVREAVSGDELSLTAIDGRTLHLRRAAQ
jgi:putative lipoprotein